MLAGGDMAAVMLANIKIAHRSSQEIAGQMTHEQNAKNYVRIRQRFEVPWPSRAPVFEPSVSPQLNIWQLKPALWLTYVVIKRLIPGPSINGNIS